ncbi:MAG TPA: hypothetical protein VFP17_09735 [Solirubrobacterales bacterium]|nr:hypothetical protein [Solirubrobacterales bacterium]
MRKTLPLLVALLMTLAPAAASAAGGGILGATASFTDPPYRYVALSPRARHPLTVVERIDMRDSTIDRWWYLRGRYYLPAVATDGTPGGISANGILVLTDSPRVYPPQRSRFAILDTRLFLNHPQRGDEAPRHAISRLRLPGAWSFDAISPDGSRVYLIHSYFKHGEVSRYEVRAMDATNGRLLPGPIVDPREPDERMEGSPVTRVSSRDGRWAYTLYTGSKERFLHALDTVRGRAFCVDLPQLDDLREPFQLRLRFADGGRTIVVYSRDRKGAGTAPLVEIDTRSLDVRQPVATASFFHQVLSLF